MEQKKKIHSKCFVEALKPKPTFSFITPLSSFIPKWVLPSLCEYSGRNTKPTCHAGDGEHGRSNGIPAWVTPIICSNILSLYSAVLCNSSNLHDSILCLQQHCVINTFKQTFLHYSALVISLKASGLFLNFGWINTLPKKASHRQRTRTLADNILKNKREEGDPWPMKLLNIIHNITEQVHCCKRA